MGERVNLAANNPDLGGGEQMLLRHAEALLQLGHPVTVVAPDSPAEVLDAAADVGADVVAIRAADRRSYVTRLRAWDRTERTGLLWCHGLVPAFATAGHANRIVHLHQAPRTRAQRRRVTAGTPRGQGHPRPVDRRGDPPPGCTGAPQLDDGPPPPRARSCRTRRGVPRPAVDGQGCRRPGASRALVPGDPRSAPGRGHALRACRGSRHCRRGARRLGARVERLGHVPPDLLRPGRPRRLPQRRPSRSGWWSPKPWPQVSPSSSPTRVHSPRWRAPSIPGCPGPAMPQTSHG